MKEFKALADGSLSEDRAIGLSSFFLKRYFQARIMFDSKSTK